MLSNCLAKRGDGNAFLVELPQALQGASLSPVIYHTFFAYTATQWDIDYWKFVQRAL